MTGISEPYTCEVCKRTFPKPWSDEEVAEEFARNFPEHQGHPLAILCDDCYVKFREWYAQQQA